MGELDGNRCSCNFMGPVLLFAHPDWGPPNYVLPHGCQILYAWLVGLLVCDRPYCGGKAYSDFPQSVLGKRPRGVGKRMTFWKSNFRIQIIRPTQAASHRVHF